MTLTGAPPSLPVSDGGAAGVGGVLPAPDVGVSALPAPVAEARLGKPALRVHLALLAAQLFFGAFHVVGKAVLSGLAPLALAGIRVALSAPLLAAIAWRHDRVLPGRRDLPLLALLGCLGVFANQILFILGLQRTTAINAAILMPSMPVFTVMVAALLGIERVSPGRLVGVLLSVAGALVLVNPARLTSGGQIASGNLLLLGNCLCYGAFLVLQRPILKRLPWRTVIAWCFVLGGAAVLPFSLPALAALHPTRVPVAIWLGVLYIVVFATVIAYSINTWAIRRSSPALVAAYTTLQPLVTAGLAATLLGERFGVAEAIGFALIAAGLWQVSAAPSR